MVTARPPRTSASSPSRRQAALEAIASPARQEILTELAEGPRTVKELSHRLGRSRQALHFHVRTLERAGLITVAEVRGTGRERERAYRPVPSASDLRAARLTAGERRSAAKAARGLLRVTEREIARTLREERFGRGREPVPALAVRAKGRLDPAAVEKLHRLLRQMMGIFRAAKGKNPDQRMLALTVVLTPAQVAGAEAARTSRPREKR